MLFPETMCPGTWTDSRICFEGEKISSFLHYKFQHFICQEKYMSRISIILKTTSVSKSSISVSLIIIALSEF